MPVDGPWSRMEQLHSVTDFQLVDDACGPNCQSGRFFDTSSLYGTLDATTQCDATLLDHDVHIARAS